MPRLLDRLRDLHHRTIVQLLHCPMDDAHHRDGFW